MQSVSSRIGMPLGLCPRQDEGLEARDGGKNRCRARRPRESRPGPEGGRDREEPGHSPALCCPPRGNRGRSESEGSKTWSSVGADWAGEGNRRLLLTAEN